MKVATTIHLILVCALLVLNGKAMCCKEKDDISLSSFIADAAFMQLDMKTKLRFLIAVYEMLENKKHKDELDKSRALKILKNVRF
jgi:hypothetical protein